MKFFLNNIYLFLKLSTILCLMTLFILMGYVFYKSYQDQSNLTDMKTEQDIILADIINDNSKKIENLNTIIKTLNSSVMIINENIKVYQNDDKEPNIKIEKIFNKLKSEIDSLNFKLQEIQKIAENKIETSPKNFKKNNLYEIINLTKLKFENGKDFSDELSALDRLGGLKISPIIEKLNIINNSNFKGNENLLMKFGSETNTYISNVVISKKNIIKPFLSFIEIQPSNKKNLNNKSLINLKNINELIIKKEYEKSFIALKSLSNYDEYFNITIEQLTIGKGFYSAIEGII